MQIMKRIYITLAIVISGIGFSGCSDWLNVEPKDSISSDKLYEAEQGFVDALTGVYLKMTNSSTYGKNLTFGYVDVLGGIYTSFPGYMQDQDRWHQNAFQYKRSEYRAITDATYSSMFNIIANVNKLLSKVDYDKGVLRTKGYKQLIKGEALAIRAFLHFDLIRLYGPVYLESPNGESIPYRFEFNNIPTEVLPASKVLEYVIKDLKEAEEILKEVDTKEFFTPYDVQEQSTVLVDHFVVNREYRMNIYAVKALLARVYAFKGDADSKKMAAEKAKEVIDSGIFTLYEKQTESSYNSIRYKEQIFGLSVDRLREHLDNNGYSMVIKDRPDLRFATNKNRFDEIYKRDVEGKTDWRTQSFSFAIPNNSGEDYNLYCMKYNQGMPETVGLNTMPLIRLPEMYYILAECLTNTAEAAEYLNTVRYARGISHVTDPIPGDDTFDQLAPEGDGKTVRQYEVMREMRKEYYGEGQIFLFLKSRNFKNYIGGLKEGMTNEAYQWPLPDNVKIFGKH